jgi:hypothetical protein
VLRRWAVDRVARWHAAFSRVLAERRFVAVGLVLLAALAQVVELLGVRGLMEEEEERERVAAEEARAEAQDDAAATVDQGGDEDMDLGVVVDRGVVEAVDTMEEESSEEKRTESRKRSAKRRKGNVIDDLFDELG